MAINPQRGDIALRLLDRDYCLRPSFAAIAAIEQRTGRGIMQLADRFLSVVFGLQETVIVVEECIKASGEACPSDLGDIIRRHGLAKLANPMLMLVRAAISGDAEVDTAAAGEPLAP